MPILAQNVGGSGPVVVIPVDDRRLEFAALDGSDLISWSDDAWIARVGLTGIDIPTREIIRQRVPGLPGSRLVEIRDDEREVFVPVWTRALDRDYRTNLAQLARVRGMLDYRAGTYADDDGTFDLVAHSSNGRRSLRCTYVDGLEGDYSSGAAYSTWRIFGLRLLAVDPYWHGQPWSTPVVALPAPAPFLSNDPADAFPRALGASVALGANMPVTVGGDVPSPAVIEITGPATSTHITSPQGLDITIGAITGGHTLLIDTGRRRRVLLDGSPAWTLLGDSPQWRALPPGEASISVQVTGADTDTRARVYGDSLWETAW